MNIHEDFEEFLRLLTAQSVEFVIIGGYAVAFHGYVRTTQDMDIFFRNTGENIRRIADALREFGIRLVHDDIAAFHESGSIIRMGVPPVRIELLNSISGCTFDEVWKHRKPGYYGSVPASFISYADLIQNKRASGRPKDIADVDELGGNR